MKSQPEQVYALCDVNSFYVSCERIFRPDLTDKPVIVLSNNDGCIISISEEAKALGIGMAVPYHEAKHIIKRHRIQTFSSNYGLYGDISARFNWVLEQFCDHVVPYSVDESFLLFEGFEQDLTVHSHKIKNALQDWLSLPVCIGLAPTKTLAKLANHFAKRNKKSTDGVVDLCCPTQRKWVLEQIPVHKIWGVGSRLSKRLVAQGIHTAWQLHNADFKVLQRMFSVNMERTVLELRGQPCLGFNELPVVKKSILNSRSFGKRITAYSDLKEALSYHATRCSEKLRGQNSMASSINLFLYAKKNHQDRSYSHSPQVTIRFPEATDDTGLFLQAVEKGLRHIFKQGTEYKKAGVMLNGLKEQTGHQSDLFQSLTQRPELMQSLDQINARFGKDAAKFASLGFDKNWAMRANSFSAHYTSRWGDILSL